MAEAPLEGPLPLESDIYLHLHPNLVLLSHSVLYFSCGVFQLSGAAMDGIIIGASKVVHFEANMGALAEGPLPSAVVDAIENAWNSCRVDCPLYFR